MSKTALIFGANGQDGTLLAQSLVTKGYNVYGVIKKKSNNKKNHIIQNLEKINKIILHEVCILKKKIIENLITDIQPQEIYYLATTHELPLNFTNFNPSISVNVKGLFNILETIRKYNMSSRLFYASSSNIFLNSEESPQNEKTLKSPNSLYGVTKMASMNLIDLYCKNYNVFACYGILYNHESSLRQLNFVSMKIIDGAVNIKNGYQQKLFLGNIDDVRDWGCAKDFVRAMWLMLQAPKAKNYIIGTGKTLSVRDILHHSFGYLGLKWENYVEIDESLFRPQLNIPLIADFSKIKYNLGWSPSRDFLSVIEEMIDDVMSFRNDNS